MKAKGKEKEGFQQCQPPQGNQRASELRQDKCIWGLGGHRFWGEQIWKKTGTE